MTTTNLVNAPTTKAKPTYSAMRYDFVPMDWANRTKEKLSAPVKFQAPIKNTTDVNQIQTKVVKPKKRVSKTSQLEEFKLKKKQFHEALLDIFRYGIECNTAIAKLQAKIAEPVSNAAIPGLAKILGTYRAYFDNTNEFEREKLFQILIQKCRTDFGKSTVIKSDKRTTEWHLLSRMFRQSERRQASSDAKILRFAHAEGVTEESFAAWVKKYGTLSNILKSAPNELEGVPKKVTKSKPFLQWITAAQVPDTCPQEALDALKRLADGKTYRIAIWHHHGRFDIMREEAAASVEADDKELPTDDADCDDDVTIKTDGNLQQVSDSEA